MNNEYNKNFTVFQRISSIYEGKFINSHWWEMNREDRELLHFSFCFDEKIEKNYLKYFRLISSEFSRLSFFLILKLLFLFWCIQSFDSFFLKDYKIQFHSNVILDLNQFLRFYCFICKSIKRTLGTKSSPSHSQTHKSQSVFKIFSVLFVNS